MLVMDDYERDTCQLMSTTATRCKLIDYFEKWGIVMSKVTGSDSYAMDTKCLLQKPLCVLYHMIEEACSMYYKQCGITECPRFPNQHQQLQLLSIRPYSFPLKMTLSYGTTAKKKRTLYYTPTDNNEPDEMTCVFQRGNVVYVQFPICEVIAANTLIKCKLYYDSKLTPVATFSLHVKIGNKGHTYEKYEYQMIAKREKDDKRKKRITSMFVTLTDMRELSRLYHDYQAKYLTRFRTLEMQKNMLDNELQKLDMEMDSLEAEITNLKRKRLDIKHQRNMITDKRYKVCDDMSNLLT